MPLGPYLYVAGASTPTVLFETEATPELDFPERIAISEKRKKKQSSFSVYLIIVTAALFIAVITWYNVISHFFEDTYQPQDKDDPYKPTRLAFGYAIIVTVLSSFIYVAFRNSI